MLQLDHVVLIAPSLEEGAEHVKAQLGIDMPSGGEHPQMGTHNLLLRLGDAVFLEVIAVNPAAPVPQRARWFGLDDTEAVGRAWDEGRRLRAWVAQTRAFDSVLAAHGAWLGEPVRVSRGDRSWRFIVRPDGSLPADGVAPPVIDWGERGNPASSMPDHGLALQAFIIEHPDPEGVLSLYERMGVTNPPEVRKGEQFRYRALVSTPDGVKELY